MHTFLEKLFKSNMVPSVEDHLKSPEYRADALRIEETQRIFLDALMPAQKKWFYQFAYYQSELHERIAKDYFIMGAQMGSQFYRETSATNPLEVDEFFK